MTEQRILPAVERSGLAPPSLTDLRRDLGGLYVANAAVAFIFAASGPVAIVLSVGEKGGLSESDLASWLFGAFCVNGLICIGFSARYRQPLGFFWTIPGTVLVGPALTHLTFPEVIGASLATGVLLLVLGLSGWVRKGMALVPVPIVMGMVAGVFFQFGVDLVLAFADDFWLALAMTVVFVGLTRAPALAARVPPLVGTLAVGFALIIVLDKFAPGADFSTAVTLPTVHLPVFSWQAMVELVIPLAITVLVVQNGQGIAILRANGHTPPVNAMTVACGGGTLVTAFLGCVPTCVTGPVNAIMSSSGELDRQYTSGLLLGVLAILFGVFSPLFTRLMLATPPAFIAVLAGLAMLKVLENAFTASFGGRFTMGALVTFLVTVADLPIAHIGAPFWGLVFGLLASWMLERRDFTRWHRNQR